MSALLRQPGGLEGMTPLGEALVARHLPAVHRPEDEELGLRDDTARPTRSPESSSRHKPPLVNLIELKGLQADVLPRLAEDRPELLNTRMAAVCGMSCLNR